MSSYSWPPQGSGGGGGPETDVNLNEVNGNPVDTGPGPSGPGTQRVAVSSDSGPLTVDGEGTAGTPAGGVVSVQGVTGGTPIPVTFTAPSEQNVNISEVNGATVNVGIGASSTGTQRVAVSSDSSLASIGSITNALPAGSNNIGSITNVTGTVSLPTGASTSALQSNIQSAPGTSATTAITVQGSASGVAIPVSFSPSGTQNTNLTEVNSNPVNVGIGASGTGTQRVSVSSDSSIASITNPVTVAQPTAANLNATVLGSGVAGTPATGVVTVQGISGGTAVPVSFSPSGTQNVNLTEVNGSTVAVGTGASGAGTQQVAVSSDSSLTSVASITNPVTVAQATAANLNATVVGTGGATLATAANQTDVQSAPGTPQTVAVTVQGNASGIAIPVSFTPSGTQNVNLTQILGSAVTTGIGASTANTERVAVSSDSSLASLGNITGTITLPTGASTSALQSNVQSAPGTPQTVAITVQGNASGVAIPVVFSASDVHPATQNITSQDTASTSTTFANGQVFITGIPTAGSAASFAVSSDESVEVMVTGTWTGTLSSEISMDGGTTWFTRGVKQAGAAYISSSFTANFAGGLNLSGMTNYRIRSTAAWTGTATVRVTFTTNNSSITVTNPLTLRDSVTQSIASTIKAASTAALTTDTSLVVALSPNSALPAGTNLLGYEKPHGLSISIAPTFNNYTITPVTTSAYVVVVTSLTTDCNHLSIFDSSGQSMILGVGAPGSEVIQLYVQPGGGEYKLFIPAGSRVAYKALTANATAGYVTINFLG